MNTRNIKELLVRYLSQGFRERKEIKGTEEVDEDFGLNRGSNCVINILS